jgi:hypothetical protein
MARRKEITVAGYEVVIDDNFHYMNKDHRATGGVFATADEAVAECKQIVDECLKPMMQPGMTAAALSEGFGDDPFIVSVDPNDARVAFFAWDYAKERCEAIIAGLPAAA